MNPDNENLTEPSRQVANLKQVIQRSEAAIAALQKLIRVADDKIRTIEGETIARRLSDTAIVSSRTAEPAINRLKMFS